MTATKGSVPGSAVIDSPKEAWFVDLPRLPLEKELQGLSEVELAAGINNSHRGTVDTILALPKIARHALICVLNTGCYLSEAQRRHKGRWLEWLKRNCPQIAKSTAYRYIALSQRFPHVGNRNSIASVRQAFAAVGLLSDAEAKKVRDDKTKAEPPSAAEGFLRHLLSVSAQLKSRGEEVARAKWVPEEIQKLDEVLAELAALRENLRDQAVPSSPGAAPTKMKGVPPK